MWIMPEVAVQRLIQTGLTRLKNNPTAFNDIFSFYTSEELDADFGQTHIDKIRTWFENTKVPVLMAWSFNAQRIPCVSVNLASEQEDEGKAGLSDFMGDGEDAEIGGSSFTTQIDIGLHADKSSDYVLWMYYIVSYILLKNKALAEKLGLRLHTWTASDYNRNAQAGGENIFSRWIRFKCTVQNMWSGEEHNEPDELELTFTYESVDDD